VEKHSREWYEQWVVGLTEGDGCWSVDRHLKPHGHIVWNIVFKISLNHSNTRAIMKAKEILGAGTLTRTPDGMVTLRIRDRRILQQRVFPLFDRLPHLSNKHYDYLRVRLIARLLDDSSLSREQRHQKISYVYSLKVSRDSLAPIWHQKLDVHSFLESGDLNVTHSQVAPLFSSGWISGFLEAEGSFYILSKDSKTHRYCHAFGFTQTGNGLLMAALRAYFRIGARVQHRKPESFRNRHKGSESFYKLETTNWRTLQFIRTLLQKTLLGMKSFEFLLWERSMKYRHDFEKLEKSQRILVDFRQKWKKKP
jgi:hypothetical protein